MLLSVKFDARFSLSGQATKRVTHLATIDHDCSPNFHCNNRRGHLARITSTMAWDFHSNSIHCCLHKEMNRDIETKSSVGDIDGVAFTLLQSLRYSWFVG